MIKYYKYIFMNINTKKMKPVKSRRYVNNNLRQLNPTPNHPTTARPPPNHQKYTKGKNKEFVPRLPFIFFIKGMLLLQK